MTVTYASALAACVERLGETTYADACDDAVTRWWNRRDDRRVLLTRDADGMWLTLADDADERVMTLAGSPSADAPLTPLPDAIDAAVRWMAERNDPAKGP